jgi:glycine oxidase
VSVFDVAIVGGGLIGAATAFELAPEKLRVLVLDRREPGREASWAAAGMLSPGPDSPDALPLVPLAKESLRLYPEFVAAVEDASGISVAFTRDGALEVFLAPHGEAERDAMIAGHRRLGLSIELVSLDAARRIEPSMGAAVRAAAWLPEEATVDPRLLTDATLEAAGQRGAEIRVGCAVSSLLRDGDRCTGVIAGGERIAARHVIVAAGCYSRGIADESENNWLAHYVPTNPVRGQMVALQPSDFRLRRVLRCERGYVVPRRDGRVVAGSTLEDAGFRNHVTAGGLRQILAAAVEMVPALAGAEVVETWAGLRPGTPDNLPILGPTDIEGLLIATGHYRNGILLAPITARLVREWITQGQTSFDAGIFSPLRFAEGIPNSTAQRGASARS